jgi:hypothetical protein
MKAENSTEYPLDSFEEEETLQDFLFLFLDTQSERATS